MLFKFLLLAVVALWVCEARKGYRRQRRPNIVFIIADDMGWNDVNYHGGQLLTPNINRLAASGTKLESHYSQPLCTPSRAEFMTGLKHIHNGLTRPYRPTIAWGLQPQLPTIGDVFRRGGYFTSLVGKWHLGFNKRIYLPGSRGFDRYHGIVTGSADHFTYEMCDFQIVNGRPAPFPNAPCGLALYEDFEPDFTKIGTYSTDLYKNKSLEMMDEAIRLQKPLFMTLSFQAPRAPLQVPEEFLKPFQNIQDTNRRVYAGMVKAMDEAIGEVVYGLKQRGLWDNTILAFISDNGADTSNGGNNFPLRGNKGSLWEGGVRVPAFVAGPRFNRAKTIAAQETFALFDIVDWLPTLAAAAGIDICPEIRLDGINQWDHLTRGEEGKRKELLIRLGSLRSPPPTDRVYNGTFNTERTSAIRIGDYKLLVGNQAPGVIVPPPEENIPPQSFFDPPPPQNIYLYNIRDDPCETNDMSASMPEKVNMMLRRLQELFQSSVPETVFTVVDDNSDPDRHGGAWVPWVDLY